MQLKGTSRGELYVLLLHMFLTSFFPVYVLLIKITDFFPVPLVLLAFASSSGLLVSQLPSVLQALQSLPGRTCLQHNL